MCFSAPRPPPDNTLLLEQMRQRDAEQARQRLEQERQQQRDQFTSRLTEAEAAARERAGSFLGARGLQGDDYNALLDRAIADARRGVPDLDANPASFFSDNIFDNALNRERDLRRQGFTTQVNQAFDPNSLAALFSDDADDPFINDILGTQRTEATDAVARASARGQLDNAGQQRALSRINELFDSGMSQAQQIGRGVLANKRNTVSGIRDDAMRSASSYDFGGNFSVDPFKQRLDTTTNDLRGQLGGSIRTALSGQNFFDIGDILNSGGRAQGAVNPRTQLSSIIAERERKQGEQRGIGGGGSF
jgi:hypothetical protein